MPSYATAAILVAFHIKIKALKYQLGLGLLFAFLFLVEVIFYPVPVKSDDTWWGWEALAENAQELSEKNPGYFIFSDDGYKTSAILDFYLDQRVYSGNIIGKNGLQFSVVDSNLQFLNHRNALFFDSDKRFDNLEKSKETPTELLPYFKEIIQLDPIVLKDKKGKPIRKFFIYQCIDYQIP